LAEAEVSIKEIIRRTGRSRKLIRSVLHGSDGDVFRCRSNMLEAHLVKLGADGMRVATMVPNSGVVCGLAALRVVCGW
jgi:hypothetical protein